MKNIIIGVGIIIVIGGVYFLGTKNTGVNVESPLVTAPTSEESSMETTATTTTTVKTDTTVVSKPVVKTTTKTASNNTLRIGQKVLLSGVNVTPNKVTYDSRCAKDVQCIQAGTVELGVLLESGNLSQNAIITLGKPFYFAERQVTLTSVTPSKVSTKTIQESEYRFSITVK